MTNQILCSKTKMPSIRHGKMLVSKLFILIQYIFIVLLSSSLWLLVKINVNH